MTNNKTIWKIVIYKTGFWLAAEVWLNLIGLDDIADYSEFIFAQDFLLNAKNRRTVKVTEYPPQFCFQIDDFCPIPGTVSNPIDLEKDSCKKKAEIFETKCQQLVKPCLKILCLTSTHSSVSITNVG